MDIPLMFDLDPLDEPFNQLCRQHMVLCQRLGIFFHFPVAYKLAVQNIHRFFERFNPTGQLMDGLFITCF